MFDVEVDLFDACFNDEVACVHVERNMLVRASYLDIEDTFPKLGFSFSIAFFWLYKYMTHHSQCLNPSFAQRHSDHYLSRA